MSLRNLSETEGIKLVQAAKKGDKQKIQKIIESCETLIKSNYGRFINKKDSISFEDFKQECNLKVMECIRNFRKENYWQFCSLVEKSIKHNAIDFIKKNRNYNDFNVICEDTISDFRDNKIDEASNFENHVVSEIVAYESYDTLIKDKLSKRESHLLDSHISGQSLKEYAETNCIKIDTARKTLKNAISKIVNKEEIRAFHCLIIIIFIYIQEMLGDLECFSILDSLSDYI
jgi:RNA polymerase sigma factor (sigma-70 family)